MNRLFFLFLLLNSPLYSMEQSRSYGPDEDAPGVHLPSIPLHEREVRRAAQAPERLNLEGMLVMIPPSPTPEEVMGQLRTDMQALGTPLTERVLDQSFFQRYDEEGNTLFHRLIIKKQPDVFKRMLSYYAEVCDLRHNTVLKENVHGWTPLHMAASYGEDEIVSFLLEFNCLFKEQRDQQGNTALHFAFYGMLGCLNKEFLIEHDKVRKLNKYKEIIIDLVDAGCRMSDLNRDGISPHELAMRNPTTQHLYQRMQRINDHRSAFEAFK